MHETGNTLMKRELFISKDASDWLKNEMHSAGYRLREVEGGNGTAIETHADLYYCRLGADTDAPVFSGEISAVGKTYPADCIYNAACTGRFFIHKLDITDKVLLKAAEEMGMILVDVPQGYSKCSVVVVDETGIITSDMGIAKKCEGAGVDVLTVEAGHIALPGFKYGFIGGASGRIGDRIYFEGDLSSHPDFEKIVDFIDSRGLKAVYNKEMPITDIGSIV